MFKRKNKKEPLKSFNKQTSSSSSSSSISKNSKNSKPPSTAQSTNTNTNNTTDSHSSTTSTSTENTTAWYLSSLTNHDLVQRIRTSIKNTHVFKLPSGASSLGNSTGKGGSRGYRGSEWTDKIWHGTLQVVERDNRTAVIFLDTSNSNSSGIGGDGGTSSNSSNKKKNNNNTNTNAPTIFAVAPIRDDENCVERCIDSSRYFVVKIENASGRHMFIGVAFNERNDAFDFNTALQDAQKEREYEKHAAMSGIGNVNGNGSISVNVNKDGIGDDGGGNSSGAFELKEGEKITVNLNRMQLNSHNHPYSLSRDDSNDNDNDTDSTPTEEPLLRVITYMAPFRDENYVQRARCKVDHQPGAEWPLYLYHF
mmetsp:Transcript_6843/g.9820  ORF Transcript_6843/g.9820 Transcript_6843/m.9820 type:complete len:366 (-) Transcript_6843:33-1130(-)